MKNVLGAALAALVITVLGAGASAQTDAEDKDNGYAVSDAGAFGVDLVNLDNPYCAADAGSLGVADLVAACN